MRKNLGVKNYLYPQTVLILGTYDENGTPDAMNAAWGMVGDNDKLMVSLSIDHKTVLNFKKTGALTISPATRKSVLQADYVGIVSGNNVPDKVEKAGLHYHKSEFVNAPVFDEFLLCFECVVESFDDETGILTAKIVNCSVDDSVMTEGKIDPDKLEAISYDGFNHSYLLVKGKVEDAFHCGLKLKK